MIQLVLHDNVFSVRFLLLFNYLTQNKILLAIMRFMGDHAMARGQTDIDCLLYLLKVCRCFGDK